MMYQEKVNFHHAYDRYPYRSLVAMVLFIQGKIRSDIIALLALVILLVFGVLTTQEALTGFANPIILI
jgi:hypothetical protein